ncbi:MAG: hypothetical protein Q8O95_04175 [bacterium]|nr:hypothetical protein [bacterium]
MTFSLLIAKIFCLAYLATGVGALSGKISFQRIIADFEKSPALTYLGGFVSLIFGVYVVQFHNTWAADWTILVTLVGWVALFKGIILISFPQSLSYFKGWFKTARTYGIALIIIGLVFGYFGFLE